VVSFGKEEELLVSLAKPLAKQTARAHADERFVELVARAAPELPGREESKNALPAPGLARDEDLPADGRRHSTDNKI